MPKFFSDKTAPVAGIALLLSASSDVWSQASQPDELAPLTVTGFSSQAYQQPTATAGTKFPVEITRVPQSVQVITEQAFRDQGAASFGDIVKQVPSAVTNGTRFTRFASVSIRGFSADQTRNGIRQLFFGDVDFSALSHVQSVEVLKGPGNILFGQGGQGGGLFNIVTKRAHDDYAAEMSFSQGAWTSGFGGRISQGRWDFNAPLTPDGALKARFTGEIEGSDTFIDFQDQERENFGLSLVYDDGGPIRAFVNAEYQHRSSLANPGLPTLGTVIDSGVGKIGRDRFLGEPNFDNLDSEVPLVQAWVEFDVLDDWQGILQNWKVVPRYQYQEFVVDQDQMRVGLARVDPVSQSIIVNRPSGRTAFQERDVFHIGQVDLTGKVITGPLTHQLYFSGEFQDQHSKVNKNFWFNRTNIPEIDALTPTYMTTPPEFDGTPRTFGQMNHSWSATVQDLVAITKYLDLYGGYRFTNLIGTQRGSDLPETDVDNHSFNIGGTIHVTDHIHLFSGYTEGFFFTGIGSLKADGSQFDPQKSEQIEAGMKVNFPWGLSGTASVFQIDRSNVVTPDLNDQNFSVQTGKIRHRGGEIELNWQANEDWYVQAGYAFLDSEITDSNAGDVGNRFRNSPTHQVNFWTHYRFNEGLLKNLSLSTGVNFVGSRPLDNTNTVELPSYTTWDLATGYDYRNMRFELFANNVLDKRFFIANDTGSLVTPGEPRSIVGRVTVKF
ncbi:MAG: TonB-dependent siderophore receptor [Methylococcales bacterium]|nr:TonB-dependent siderophore receptor [Methylococcales bacterium]